MAIAEVCQHVDQRFGGGAPAPDRFRQWRQKRSRRPVVARVVASVGRFFGRNGYAQRIAALVGAAPASVLDVGCGNGALLLALGLIWPAARRQGMEPAPAAAAAARRAGLDVRQALAAGQRAALVVSVNVVEHTPDPLAFLRRLRSACARGGAVVVICPDAGTPWLEMLLLDHRHCLTPAALEVLAVRAGLAVQARQTAPEGGFQALLLRPVMPGRCGAAWLTRTGAAFPRRGEVPRAATPALSAERRRYLAVWRALDRTLLAQSTPARRLLYFGTGEAARLLRCYAPALWVRVAAVTAVTADDLTGAAALGKPVLPLEEVMMARDELLLAVRPQAQAGLAARLASLAMLDDFTAESGATWFLPSSHLHADFPGETFVGCWAPQALAPAGSVVVFDAMCFLAGGVNRGAAPRRAVNTLFGIPLLAQQVSFTPRPGMDARLRRRLGLDYQPQPSADAWRAARHRRLHGDGT